MEEGVLAGLYLGNHPGLSPVNHGIAPSTYREEQQGPATVALGFVEQQRNGVVYWRAVPGMGQPGMAYTATEGVSSDVEQYYFSLTDPRVRGGVTEMTSSIEDILNRAIELGIAVSNPEEVRKYLFGYSGVRDIVKYVFEICREDIDRLKLKNTLSLGVYHDPEIRDEYLILNILPGTDDEEAVDEVFNEIDNIRKKYIPQTVGKSGWLQVTIDVTS